MSGAKKDDKMKKSEGGFVHAVKKTVGKITVDVTVDPKYAQAKHQLNLFGMALSLPSVTVRQ
jgi:hypothetical protein